MNFPLKPLAKRVLRFFSKPDVGSGIEIGTYDAFQVAYRRNSADERVIGHSFDNDIFFRELTDMRLDDCKCIIDAGAHIGTFSLLAAKKYPNAKVHAIEASKDSFNLCAINIALNRLENAIAHRLAIGINEPTVTLHHDVGNWGHSAVSKLSSRSEQVPGCSLPRFLKDQEIETCDLMKLNCEGSEFPLILETPDDVLKRIKNILILYHTDLWTHNSLDELKQKLETCGYSMSIRNKTELRGWIVAKS